MVKITTTRRPVIAAEVTPTSEHHRRDVRGGIHNIQDDDVQPSGRHFAAIGEMAKSMPTGMSAVSRVISYLSLVSADLPQHPRDPEAIADGDAGPDPPPVIKTDGQRDSLEDFQDFQALNAILCLINLKVPFRILPIVEQLRLLSVWLRTKCLVLERLLPTTLLLLMLNTELIQVELRPWLTTSRLRLLLLLLLRIRMKIWTFRTN